VHCSNDNSPVHLALPCAVHQACGNATQKYVWCKMVCVGARVRVCMCPAKWQWSMFDKEKWLCGMQVGNKLLLIIKLCRFKLHNTPVGPK